MSKPVKYMLVVYVIMFVVTFGHSFEGAGESNGLKTHNAFYISAFWPLYWSVQVFK